METKYLCPHCNGKLSLKEDIILIAQKDVRKGFVILHTELGNYQSKMDCSLDIHEGETVDFICPLCHANLDHEKEGKNLTHIKILSATNKESDVYFSKKFGEKATYHIENKEVLSFGEHAKLYMNPDWYLA